MQDKNISYVKQEVTSALFKLIKLYKYSEITVSQIVLESKVSRSSFYRNFIDKDDILRQYLRGVIVELQEESKKDNEDLFSKLFNYFYENKDLYVMLYDLGLYYFIHENIKEICALESEKNNITAYIKSWFIGAMTGLLDEWISRGMQEPPEEMLILMGTHKKIELD